MEPVMTCIIAAIIMAIILVAFNKQQENKVASNSLYTNDVQQLYLLTAAEYKINALENQQQLNVSNNNNEPTTPNIAHELEQLTIAYESGEIRLDELNTKLDYLLNTLNINNSILIQAY
jgi:acyl-CoA synthetase (AMP-forming)/AMP-acid ligase II